MKLLFKIFLSLLAFFVIPSVILVAVLNLAGTKVVNSLLKLSVNSPARVEKFETNWLLTEMVLENLRIYNPEGFPKGKLLEVGKILLKLSPKSYLLFGPYAEIEIENGYLHFVRRSDNATNVAVAFKIPYERAKVKPLTFEVKKLKVKLYVETLEKVRYTAEGIFKGFGNNSEFEIKGFGNLESKETVTDFTVYNWRIRNNPLLSTLAEILNEPKLKDLILSKIEGRIETKGDWLIFSERDTKAFVTNDVLFAVIHKGSKYNIKTKEVDAEITLYLPLKMTVRVSGTSDSPKVEILKLKGQEVKEKIKALEEKVFQNLLNKFLPIPSTPR
ncbi:MAG: hypothetical protein DSZ30_06035 [Aquificaceae bacterium]|nr:MAG: hypothetical protein DSZ30_06035 [Aquificaceae bacterium]